MLVPLNAALRPLSIPPVPVEKNVAEDIKILDKANLKEVVKYGNNSSIKMVMNCRCFLKIII